MGGGTLVVSRAVNLHGYFHKQLLGFGYKNVMTVSLVKDALYSFIVKQHPDILLMGAGYYYGCTPYMMRLLKKKFPDLKMAAVTIGEYPIERAMAFIINGIESYVSFWEGEEQFYEGIKIIKKGGKYVSPEVIERIKMKGEYPLPAGLLTEREIEIIRLICNGFNDIDIGDTLEISRRTVDTHKTKIFRSLNVRKLIELMAAAQNLQIITNNELVFYPNNYLLFRKPVKKTINKGGEI